MAVIVPLAPTFTVATEKTPVPVVPRISTIPLLVRVAARATISDTGAAEADNNRVLRPVITGAGLALAHAKRSWTSVGAKAAVGVKAKTKVWFVAAAISTGLFAAPVTAFVVGFVVL